MRDLVLKQRLGTILGPLDELPEDVIAEAAAEIALYEGRKSDAELAALRGPILTRAHARVEGAKGQRPRAEWCTPLGFDDVDIRARRLPYSRFFAVEELELSHKMHDGTATGEMLRAGFLMADAVTVLPYDPIRDRVLVIEQFRVGPYLRADKHPWMVEPIAGRVDPGEEPEATARREVEEESGASVATLHKIAEYYPSSGAISEYVYSYIGIADLPDDITGIAGLESEHEDIASTLLSFDALMQMCDAGQLDVGPLYMSALWLARHKDRLRGA